MNNQKLKQLIERVLDNKATDDEKLLALNELNLAFFNLDTLISDIIEDSKKRET
jgi:hypothetical protein